MLAAVVLLVGSAAADEVASIRGTATATGGGPLAGASVQLETRGRSAVAATVADAQGAFMLHGVPSGRFVLVVSHVGYRTARRGVTTAAGDTLTANLSLVPLAVELGETVVTATRSPRPREQLPIRTDVISRREIDRRGAVRLSEVLADQAGLHLVEDHGTGVQVQGLDADYTLILVDGEPVIGRTAGTLELSRLALGDVERIEVVQGPSSSLYGSEALAGVVNLITRNPGDSLGLRLRSRVDGLGSLDAGADARWRRQRLGAALFLERSSGSGYDLDPQTPVPTAPAFIRHTVRPLLSWELAQGSVDLAARLYRQTQEGLSSAATDQGELLLDEREVEQDWSLAPRLELQPRPGLRWSLKGYATGYRSHQVLRGRQDGAVHSRSRFEQRYDKVETQIDAVPTGSHRVTAGAGVVREQVAADRIAGGRADARSLFAYAQQEWMPAATLDVVASGRLDVHSDYAARFSPKVAALLRPAPWLKVRASAGSGFKAPEFRQLYLDFTNPTAGYSVYGVTGVAQAAARLEQDGQIARWLRDPAGAGNLRPETSRSLAGGLEVEPYRRVSLRLELFRNDVADLIEAVPFAVKANGQSAYTYYNLEQVRTEGLEVHLRLGPARRTQLTAGYQLLEAWDTGIRDEVAAGRIFKRDASGRARPVRPSEYGGLFGRARHSGALQLSWDEEARGVEACLRGVLQGRSGYADANGNGILDEGTEYRPGYAVWNGSVSKRVGARLRARASIDNVLDATRQDPTGLPGRVLHAGLDFEL